MDKVLFLIEFYKAHLELLPEGELKEAMRSQLKDLQK